MKPVEKPHIDRNTNAIVSLFFIQKPFRYSRPKLRIKADISTSNIALLTGRTKSTITSARKKLYEKVYGQKGDAKMWDDLILSL